MPRYYFGDRGPRIGDPQTFSAPFFGGGALYLVGNDGFGAGPVFILAALGAGPAYDGAQYAAGGSAATQEALDLFGKVCAENRRRQGMRPPGGIVDPLTWPGDPSGERAAWNGWNLAPVGLVGDGPGRVVDHALAAGEEGGTLVRSIVDLGGKLGKVHCLIDPGIRVGIITGRTGMRTGGEPAIEVLMTVVSLVEIAIGVWTGNVGIAVAGVSQIVSTWATYAGADGRNREAGKKWLEAIAASAQGLGDDAEGEGGPVALGAAVAGLGGLPGAIPARRAPAPLFRAELAGAVLARKPPPTVRTIARRDAVADVVAAIIAAVLAGL